jgi:integrase
VARRQLRKPLAVCPDGKDDVILYDDQTTGFALRVTLRGKKTWQAAFRVHGLKQRVKVGQYPTMSCKDARARCEAYQRRRRWRERRRRKAHPSPGLTFGEMVDKYEVHITGKLRSAAVAVRRLRHYCAALDRRPAASIAKPDIRAIVDALRAKEVNHMANAIVGHVHALFRVAMQEDWIGAMVNPAATIKKTSEDSRARVLDDDEIRRFWQKLANRSNVFRDIGRVAMLTSQRRTEVAEMEWSEINLGAATWDIPGDRTKNGAKHHVPLSAPVIEILRSYSTERTPDDTCKYVFSNSAAPP